MSDFKSPSIHRSVSVIVLDQWTELSSSPGESCGEVWTKFLYFMIYAIAVSWETPVKPKLPSVHSN